MVAKVCGIIESCPALHNYPTFKNIRETESQRIKSCHLWLTVRKVVMLFYTEKYDNINTVQTGLLLLVRIDKCGKVKNMTSYC